MKENYCHICGSKNELHALDIVTICLDCATKVYQSGERHG